MHRPQNFGHIDGFLTLTSVSTAPGSIQTVLRRGLCSSPTFEHRLMIVHLSHISLRGAGNKCRTAFVATLSGLKKPQDFKITTYSSRNLATDATLAWTCEEASPVQTSSYEKSETKSYCRAPWCVLLVLPSYPSYPTLAAATVQSELSRISRWRICIQSGLLGNTP